MDGTERLAQVDDQDGVTAPHPERADLVLRYAQVTEELDRGVKNPFEEEVLRTEQKRLAEQLQG